MFPAGTIYQETESGWVHLPHMPRAKSGKTNALNTGNI